jgi:hypothetical protein
MISSFSKNDVAEHFTWYTEILKCPEPPRNELSKNVFKNSVGCL